MSVADDLNATARRLVTDGSISIPLPEHLQGRLHPDPLFRFGFGDFRPDEHHDRLFTWVRVALKCGDAEPYEMRSWEEPVFVTKHDIKENIGDFRLLLIRKLATACTNLCEYIAVQHDMPWEEYDQLVKERH